MFKRNITYENFNGDTVTGIYYFNVSQVELLEYEVSFTGGMQGTLQRIIDTQDHKTLVEEFKKIILMSYGVKSDDGESFVKSDELRDKFMQTAAFNALFMELATQDGKAAEFINAVMPKEMPAQSPKNVLNVPIPYNPDIGGPIPVPQPPFPKPIIDI